MHKRIKDKDLTIVELNTKLEKYKLDNEEHRLSIGKKIKSKTVKIKDGILKSKEIKVYENSSVENYSKRDRTKAKFFRIKE